MYDLRFDSVLGCCGVDVSSAMPVLGTKVLVAYLSKNPSSTVVKIGKSFLKVFVKLELDALSLV